MRSNVLLIIEVILSILFIYFLLSFRHDISYDIKGFREEDLFSSLISINYLNILEISTLENVSCSIAASILDEYAVFINDTMICNNTDKNLTNSIKVFYIINGTPIFLTLYMK